jgi:hypothetical protein
MDFFVACLAYTLQRIVFVVKRGRFFCQHCTFQIHEFGFIFALCVVLEI